MLTISHDRALVDYLAMGVDRSLRKLMRSYDEDDAVKTPAWSTLCNWSRRYGWVEKAREHDEAVAGEVQGRTRAARVESEWDRVQALTEVSRGCLELAIEVLQAGDIRLKNASDVKAVVDCAISILKLVEGRDEGNPQDCRPVGITLEATKIEEFLKKMEDVKQANKQTKPEFGVYDNNQVS